MPNESLVSLTGHAPEVSLTPFAEKLQRLKTNIQFLTYPQDGTLRLFKRGQILGETPASYSEDKVLIKARVTSPTEDFVVVLDVTRKMLDEPGVEERLAEAAYNLSNER